MNIADTIEAVSTSNLSDALDHLGIPCRWLSEELMPVKHSRFWGYADTVMWGPSRKGGDIRSQRKSTWDEVGAFVKDIKKEGGPYVYVAGALTISRKYVLAGGMSMTYVDRSGYAGCVLNGSVRDYEELEVLSMPIWHSNYGVMDSQGCMVVESRGEGCVVGGHWVNQGDLIVGDRNGVISLPASQVEEVLARALEVNRTEERILERVRAGEDLYEMVSHGGHI